MPEPTPSTSRARSESRGPFRAVLDLFSSVWFGVAILVVLFIYMSIGSALYAVRQTRFFEMSEFEWFNWWPFSLLIALLCVSLVVVTVRRIRFNAVNLGVWMIHAGIVTMSLGSVYYFVTKVEGDSPVFRRVVSITAPNHEPVIVPALPGASVDATTTDGETVRYTIAETDPRWPLLSGEDKGKQVYSVSVLVQKGDAIDTPPFMAAQAGPPKDKAEAAQKPFIRQLFVGYPQYTEDVIPGLGRAKNIVGSTSVDDGLSMSLEHDAQEWYHIVHTWALYTRPVDAQGAPLADWTQRPLPSAGAGTNGRMPRYNDYLVDRSEVWLPNDDRTPIDPLRVRADPANAGAPFADVDLTVTGYLRYAPNESRRVAGDHATDPLAPFATVRLSGRGLSAVYALEAFDPERSSEQGGNLVFRWLEPGEDASKIGIGTPAKILIELDGTSATLSLDGSIPVGADAPFRAIGDSGWSIKVNALIDDLPIAEGFRVSFADVVLRTSEGEIIERWIASDPSVTNDIERAPDADPNDPSAEQRVAPDPRVRTFYAPPVFPPAITLVGSHDNESELLAVLGVFRGDPVAVPLSPGGSVKISDEVTLDLLDFAAHSRVEMRPRIIPEQQRDRDLGVSLAQARVQIDTPTLEQPLALWVPFTQNLLPSPEYSYGGRFPYEPVIIDLPDGRRMEMVFSRERRKLPSPVVLEDFVLHEQVGGFTGDTASIRDWESVLRFVNDDGSLGEIVTVRTNTPGEFGGYRFFQAMWDPPAGEQTGSPSAGLNFTGLGIGNRNGVYIMLFGGTLSVVGAIYAFYVKPVIKRRRAAEVRARIEAGEYGEHARRRARAGAQSSAEFDGIDRGASVASREIGQ
jgi:hypothetical protein